MNSARIRKSHSSCTFVKALPCRIVTGSADYMKLCITQHFNNMTVCTACDYTQIRRFKFLVTNVVSGNMTCNVMYGNKRFSSRKSKCLCKIHSDKQCTDKSRSICYSNSVNVGKCYFCIIKSLTNNTKYIFTMTA